MTDIQSASKGEADFDAEFLTAECLLRMAVAAFMPGHDADREAAKYWLRLAGEVVLDG